MSEDRLHVAPEQLGAMLAARGPGRRHLVVLVERARIKLPSRMRNLPQVFFGERHYPATLFDAEVEDQWGAVC